MEPSEIKKLKTQVIKALEEKRIKDAFHLLSLNIKELQNSDLIDSHYNLEMSYKSILHYASESNNDPNRHQIFNHLLANIYQLSDKSIELLLIKYSGEYTYETIRSLTTQKNRLDKTIISSFINQCEDIKLKSLVANQESISKTFIDIEIKIFNLIWLNEEDNIEIYKLIQTIFSNKEIPWHSKSLFVSAIMLNLLRCWNLRYLLLLFELADNTDEPNIQMKAATALIISLFKYDKRLSLYPEIEQRLKLLKDKKDHLNILQTIIIQLIRTKETEKISKKLTNEIIPEVTKLHPNIHEKLDLDNLTSGFQEDKNPEWKDFFSETPELMNKLEEISKLQMEGADVFLSTFQMLKHFPFFNQFTNWFMPFYINHPSIKEAINESGKLFVNNDLIDNISDSGFLCNSDKYSLMLSIPHMPSFQRNMMGQMFKAEIEQMGEIQKDQFSIDPSKKKLVISNQYIQDLYRFFKVHPSSRQFEDIFNWKLDFYNNWFFKQLYSNSEPIRQIGEFLFNKNYMNEALDVFKQLSTTHPDNIEVTQKMAYCYQQMGYFKEALNLYKKADILKPDNRWTLKKIAFCYKKLNKQNKALEFYLHVAKLDPDNLQIQASIGSCYLDIENYEEALKYYFKVEYADPSNTKVWRPIGWCSFVLGKLDQAEKYYQKLLISDQNNHDLIYIGHVQLCKGLRKEALHYYLKSLGNRELSIEEFCSIFHQDSKYLIKYNLNTDDIPILLDQLRYLLDQ
ncbi:MAG: hypothetical protein JW717_10680 [Marinilabiliaceae bacterium]|nr:hypothetical protein [Marinilabiliaceae bacterium]